MNRKYWFSLKEWHRCPAFFMIPTVIPLTRLVRSWGSKCTRHACTEALTEGVSPIRAA